MGKGGVGVGGHGRGTMGHRTLTPSIIRMTCNQIFFLNFTTQGMC